MPGTAAQRSTGSCRAGAEWIPWEFPFARVEDFPELPFGHRRLTRPQGARANTLGAPADVDYDGVAKKAGHVVGFSSVKDSVIDGFCLWS